MIRRTVTLAAATLMALGMMAGPSLAQHPAFNEPNEPLVGAHQHYVNGQRVGPNSCANGTTLGSDHFHINAHLGKAGLGVFGHGGDGLGIIESDFTCD